MTLLPRYTWAQAERLQLATARGFEALGIKAATIRSWAADGLIQAAGKAPGGAHLYDIGEVSAAAGRPRKRAGRPARSGTLNPNAKSPTLRSRQ